MTNKMKNWIFTLAFIGLMVDVHGQISSLRANFNIQGVTGSATLTWDTDLSVEITLDDALNGVTVEVRPMWVNYDGTDICIQNVLGQAEAGLTSTEIDLVASVPSTVLFSNAPQLEDIEGMSLVLSTDDKVVCSTIEQDAAHVTAFARFRSASIYGEVQLRQAVTDGSVTRVVANLASPTYTSSADWRITDSFASCEEFEDGQLINIYSPAAVDEANCGPDNQQACAVGDLTGKLSKVQISDSLGGTGWRAYTDRNLPLSGDSTVGGLLLIVIPDDDSVAPACGVVDVFVTRSAKATFSHDGVEGTITLSQDSPLDPTIVQVDLQGLNAEAGGWHVHKWPVPEKISSAQGSMCGADYVSGHFNPFIDVVGEPADATYPATAASTADMYEVGDLSGKFGTLAGKTSFIDEFTDWNLQLFGSNSVLARSLVIHRDDADASRWVCANLEPQHEVIAAEALLLYPVFGHVRFMQSLDIEGGETSVYAWLDYVDTTADTSGHSWMITGSAVGADQLSSDVSQRCLTSGDTVYNPDDLWSGSSTADYAAGCAVNGPLACKTGDLTGQVGTLSVGNSAGTADKSSKFFNTAISLPLSGADSIVGKSLVVQTGEGDAHLACSAVVNTHARALAAEIASVSINGKVTFTQNVGFGERQTAVQVDLDGFTDSHSLVIRELPPAAGSSPCDDLGETYDPLGGSEAPAVSTDDQYKVGDLSRHGIETSYSTYNLPLAGPNSVKGRSLAVVDGSNTVITCSQINLDLSGWTLVEAKTTFTAEVDGTIYMYQHVNPDGATSDTTIVLDVGYVDASEMTPQHNWHTHEKRVTGDANSDTDRCASTGGHYNPFRVDVDNDYTECSIYNPLRCELGDQANKALPYDVGGGRKLFTDVYEPLTGSYTVQGRSYVIHVENRGADRYACADIEPMTTNYITVTFTTPASWASMDEDAKAREIGDIYTEAIQAEDGEVVVVIEESTTAETTAIVHFIGVRSDELNTRFNQVINDESMNDTLGPYDPIISDGAK